MTDIEVKALLKADLVTLKDGKVVNTEHIEEETTTTIPGDGDNSVVTSRLDNITITIGEPSQPPQPPQPPTDQLIGPNLAGMEFGSKNLPGTPHKDYAYIPIQMATDWLEAGFKLIRYPFRWERLAPNLGGEFDSKYLDEMLKFVNAVTSNGGYVILDMHNYASYKIGGDKKLGKEISTDQFADVWASIAKEFKHPNVLYGLMNEPVGIEPNKWYQFATAATKAIRDTGAKNTIMVSSTGWNNSKNFVKDGNAEAYLKYYKDPLNNSVIETHTYLDDKHSGANGSVGKPGIGVERIKEITGWAKNNNQTLHLGEFGIGDNKDAYYELDDMLRFMSDNNDVWKYWSIWADGPWWGNYHFAVSINDTNDERIKIMKKYV